jgi:hypothetical protein
LFSPRGTGTPWESYLTIKHNKGNAATWSFTYTHMLFYLFMLLGQNTWDLSNLQTTKLYSSQFHVCWALILCFQDDTLPCWVFTWQKAERQNGMNSASSQQKRMNPCIKPFYKGLNTILEGSALMT